MSKNIPKPPSSQKGSEKSSRKKQAINNDLGDIAYCKIYPGLGIARIGNSPDEYFIGPEAPGHPPNPVGGFKDQFGRIKRQAARFRIYAFNSNHEAIKEITADDGHQITWTVELANQKPAYEMFLGEYWDIQYPGFDGKHPLRNQEITNPEDRQKYLVIRPGPRTISGADQKGDKYQFDKGTIGPLPYTKVTKENEDCLAGSRSGFMNVDYPVKPAKGCTWGPPGKVMEPVEYTPQVEVPLGELRTDKHGRLLVLGGLGNSASLIEDNPIGYLNEDSYYANNDYWYDDSSDGPVSAEVILSDGRKVDVVDKAWVLVVPPKYSPTAEVLTTLYEVAMTAVTPPEPEDVVKVPSFTKDIYPVLYRLSGYQWVNSQASRQHGAGKVYDVLDPKLFNLLRTPDKDHLDPHNHSASVDETYLIDARNAREHLFKRLRKPKELLPDQDIYSDEARSQANHSYMPQMAGDGGEPITEGSPEALVNGKPVPGGTYLTWLTLTEQQYLHFRSWAEGKFKDDWPKHEKPTSPPKEPPFRQIPVKDQPAALDKAALELCVGGAFYPGIEMTYIARYADTWSGPCRLNQSYVAGDVTRHMALPWQADFSECKDHWWPAQRPDDVVPELEYESFLKTYDASLDGPMTQVLQYSEPWARGIATQSPQLDNDMVEAWKDFGFVVPKPAPGDQIVYVETERSPFAGMALRDYFYYLMNIDDYPEFLPKARSLVEEFLAQARKNEQVATFDHDERYSSFVYTPETFNARMNQIYNDYVTDNASAEVYEANLQKTREQVIYGQLQMSPFNQLDGAWIRNTTPNGPIDDISSMLFSIYMDEMGDGNVQQQHCNVYTDMLKSLNIYLPDLHTREYADNAALLDSAFVEPVFLLAISEFSQDYFPEILGMTLYLEWGSVQLIASVDQLEAFGIDPIYYSLHVGIDNAASGHGAIAKRAVELYLDEVRQGQGDAAMQEIWKRIWNGYVAFGTLGTLGADIEKATQNPPSLQQQMQDMITRKAPYASLNHREKKVSATYINDWFLDPQGFLNALVQAGYVIPGKPEISPIFQLMSFNGPMYHVFTDDEQELWRAYVLSLGEKKPEDTLNIVQAMHDLINYLRNRQAGNTGHKVMLKGPNPYKDADEPFVTRTIDWWFNLNQDARVTDPDGALMKALSFEENGWIVKGNAAVSPLITSILAGNNDMAKAFRNIEPKTGGLSYKEVFVQWVDLGCPTEEVAPKAFAAARAVGVAPALTVAVHPEPKRRRRLWGMGKVH